MRRQLIVIMNRKLIADLVYPRFDYRTPLPLARAAAIVTEVIITGFVSLVVLGALGSAVVLFR